MSQANELIEQLGIVDEDLSEKFEREPARIEERTLTGDALYKAVKKIADDGDAAKINGVLVDITTASAIMKVAGKVNAKVRAKMFSLPIDRIAASVWKLLNR